MKEVKIKKSNTIKKIRRKKIISCSSSSKSVDLELNLKESKKKLLNEEKSSNCHKETNYVNINNNNSKNNDNINSRNVRSNCLTKLDKVKKFDNENTIKKNKNNSKPHNNNCDLELMKKTPPKMPDIFSHIYDFNNDNTLFKDNETYGTIDRGKVPNIFYNHLLIYNNKSSYTSRFKKKRKISLTQRNKKKLLTIIYYSP